MAKQRAAMRSVWPRLTCKAKSGRLTCVGRVRPSPLSAEYLIRLEYEADGVPKVWVDAPELKRRADGQPIPHVYPGSRPCLFRPGDWHGSMSIAATVMPWLLLWLLFYEGWHATGQWYGGGEHPASPKPDAEGAHE